MGKQQKLKAQRKEEKKKQKEQQGANPPTLGVQTAEVVGTSDRFGG